MRFSSSVLSAVVLVAWAVAGPDATVDALERDVAALLPGVLSANMSARVPAAAALAAVLEQAAADIARDAESLAPAALAVVDDMVVAVHAALGGARAPWAARVDGALDRLLRATSVAPDACPDPSPDPAGALPALVLNPAA